ncbi:hypothetical protein Mapa_004861 [Marchantia paleacea]|nr:hypothetical protein Mapa_004861 [Marchantia paleacea]
MTAEHSPHASPESYSSFAGKGSGGPLLGSFSLDSQGTALPSQFKNMLDSQPVLGAKQDVTPSNGKSSSPPSSLHVLAGADSSPNGDRQRELLGTRDTLSQSSLHSAPNQIQAKFREERDGIPRRDTYGNDTSSVALEYSGRTDRTETTTTSDYTTEVESTSTEQTSLTRSTLDSEQQSFPQRAPGQAPAVGDEHAAENPSLLTGLPQPAKPSMLRTSTVEKEESLKKLVVIPEYLGKGMSAAVDSSDSTYLEGPQLTAAHAPGKPILVFINSKSGGRLGPELEALLVELIAPNQVYDLSKCKPVPVLRYGLGYLEEAARAGDECARATRNNLRIMVAGGDGTVGWVLSSVAELERNDEFKIPPVGVIPLGTGNDLSRSFRWGGSFTKCTRSSVRRFLVKATEARVSTLDSWQVVVKPAPSRKDDPLKLPHCMKEQHHIPLENTEKQKYSAEESPNFVGAFYNYFSVGMDAQVAYGFHHLRDEAPWLARGRLSNQLVYTGYGCVQGWFCTACSTAPRARGIRHSVKLKVIKFGGSGEWEDLELPPSVRAIVVLNLQSYAGGRNPWGNPSANRLKREGFVEARADDGILEVVGLRDGWHTAVVLLELLTAFRLAQVVAVRLEMGGNRERAYMQMDGEPWQQPLGSADDIPAVVEIGKVPHASVMLSRK